MATHTSGSSRCVALACCGDHAALVALRCSPPPFSLQSTTARAELSKDIVYSPKVFGLCLYMARLLRPVWRWSIITFADATADPRRGRSRHAKTGLYPHRRFDSDELRRVARPLAELRNVLESIYDTLGRDDDDDYLDEEPTTAQHLQALKEGAAGRSGAGAGAGAGAVSSSANNKAVRVEHGYVRSLYRCVCVCEPGVEWLGVGCVWHGGDSCVCVCGCGWWDQTAGSMRPGVELAGRGV